MNNNKSNLINELETYSRSDMYPFHMPGHKRNIEMFPYKLPFDIDITEIYGFDNLHDPHGILKQSQDKAKKLFGSDYAYMLVNGSTCGILSAVCTVTGFSDEIVIARNCHKSVYNACKINNLDIHFIYPPQDKESDVCGSINAQEVHTILKQYPNSKAVVITSPTYEGVISDIKSIAEIVHGYGIPLIVDNAHGAHQKFCESSRKGEPLECGADLVISSLHKTLPSLTQTAVANLQGELINHRTFEEKLSVFETSSPSYVLMSSMDMCIDFLGDSRNAFKAYCDKLAAFSEKMKGLKNLRILCHGEDTIDDHRFFGFDMGKITISTSHTNITGVQLMEILRANYRLELEMAYHSYAVAMTSVCDSEEGFIRLAQALLETDGKLQYCEKPRHIGEIPKPQKADSNTNKSLISSKYIYAYPPGVPIVIPGEIIDADTLNYLKKLKNSGVELKTSR